jgi:hypothetical protein
MGTVLVNATSDVALRDELGSCTREKDAFRKLKRLLKLSIEVPPIAACSALKFPNSGGISYCFQITAESAAHNTSKGAPGPMQSKNETSKALE